MMDFNHLLFSSQGRISRKPYWLGLLAIVMASMVLTISLAHLFHMPLSLLISDEPRQEVKQLNLLVDIILFWPGYALSVKRLHDHNKGPLMVILLYALYGAVALIDVIGLAGPPSQPTSLFLIFALPFVLIGLWLFIQLGFRRGTSGDNRFGPDPLASEQAALGPEN
jgi:uncharacterized membrane protein YhaH (DUF805 family)